jgi:large subunit ribosomal protein L24
MKSKNRLAKPLRIELKKDDVVVVIAGKDKGKEGRVLSVDPWTGRVLVEHVGMIKRHTRPNPSQQIKGGIAERESAIHVSNVMIKGPHGPTRIKHHVTELGGGKKRRERVCAKTGETLDRK